MVFTVYVIKEGVDELDANVTRKDLKDDFDKLNALNDDVDFIGNGHKYKKDLSGNIKMRNITRILCEENGLSNSIEANGKLNNSYDNIFTSDNEIVHGSECNGENGVRSNVDKSETIAKENYRELVGEVCVDEDCSGEELGVTRGDGDVADGCRETSNQESAADIQNNGATAATGDWMTVSSSGRAEPPAAQLDAEPLVESVRTFLAGCEPVAKPHAGDLNNNARAAMSMPPDLLQRQPLLKPAPHSAPPAAPGELAARRTYTGDFVLELPRDEPDHKYPRDIGKFLLSFLFLCVCVCINMISLSLVHERLPDRNTTLPLHDIVLDNVAARDWGLPASEYIIIVSTTIAGVVVAFHKHRFIVSRRLFFIIGLLYLYRSVTMFITVVPVSSTTYYCSPQTNDTSPLTIASRVVYLISGFGLSINGKHTYCGDYIYSGHTMVLVLSYLVVAEYSPRRLWPLQWALWAAALGGVALVLLAHGHYTLDVVVAYYITTRLFWAYHSLLTTPPHAAAYGYMLQREWWYPLFRYLERGSRGPVPRRYNWPLPALPQWARAS